MLKKIKYYNTDTQQWETVAVSEKGEQGPEGPAGPQGPEGPIGPAFTYDDFTEEQLAGLVGPEGPQGPKGERGQDGVFSNSISAIEIVGELPAEGEWVNGTLYIVVEGEGGE